MDSEFFYFSDEQLAAMTVDEIGSMLDKLCGVDPPYIDEDDRRDALKRYHDALDRKLGRDKALIIAVSGDCGPTGPTEPSRVGLAAIRKGFPFPEINIEQPLASAGLGQTHRLAFAVVKNVCGLVYDKILERVVLAEVGRRYEARCLLTQPDKTRCIFGDSFRTDAEQIQIRQIPGGAFPRLLIQELLDVVLGQEDHRPLQHHEHLILFRFWEKSADHGRNLTPRKFGRVFDGYEFMGAPCGTTPHFSHECST